MGKYTSQAGLVNDRSLMQPFWMSDIPKGKAEKSLKKIIEKEKKREEVWNKIFNNSK